jgi:putative transposase
MHQSLEYRTPDEVYLTASGGGAKIVDKYSKTEKISSEIETKIGAAPFRCINRVPS